MDGDRNEPAPNPILDKQIQDQQADIEKKRQDLAAERIAVIRSRQQSWEPGSIDKLGRSQEVGHSRQYDLEQRAKEIFKPGRGGDGFFGSGN